MSAPPPKEYGLIQRKKPTSGSAAPPLAATKFSQSSRLAAFADSSSDDSDSAPSASATKSSASKVNVTLGAAQQRQIAAAQSAALAADPTIYQYDELYDDLQAKRDSAKVAARQATSSTDKPKPKYIERLLVTAESRKKEYERRIERQVQKERDAEGAQFADKEQFVTASYRAKLEEMRAAEVAEQRDEYLEAIGDVRKQRDLGGFYRHLYEQRMGGEGEEKGEVPKPELPAEVGSTKVAKGTAKTTRTYRKRDSAGSADSGEEESGSKEAAAGKSNARKEQHHLQSNLDADSDFSIDSSSDEDEAEKDGKKTKEASAESDQQAVGSVEAVAAEFAKPEMPAPKPAQQTENAADESVAAVPEVTEVPAVEAPKIRVNIWLKRTVGDVLEAAIQRYQERKVARLADEHN